MTPAKNTKILARLLPYVRRYAWLGVGALACLAIVDAASVLQPYLSSGKLTVPSGQTAFTEVATQAWDGAVAQKRMTKLLAGPDAGVTSTACCRPTTGSRGAS